MEIARYCGPSTRQIEISIFGKGFGECVVVHLYGGHWLIVDSYTTPLSKEPIAIEYLRSIHVDYKKAVKVIVATHWHDDHICGLSKIVHDCNNAQFVCSEAIGKREFLEFIYSDSDLHESRPGIKELRNILETLSQRKGVLVRAVESKVIIDDINYKILSLSPSDYAITLAQQEICDLLPKAMKPRRGIPCIQPNNTSVVLLINVNGHAILLGADLENSSDDRLGWARVISAPGRPRNLLSNAFKIPHHGSDDSNHESVWNDLLTVNPCSFLTSFIKGRCILPKRDDIERILGLTNQAWITTNPYIKRRPYKRDRTVEKTIKDTVRSMRSISDTGHIRMRLDSRKNCDSWDVELFDAAVSLDQCKVSN
jgi:hypothetical protein